MKAKRVKQWVWVGGAEDGADVTLMAVIEAATEDEAWEKAVAHMNAEYRDHDKAFWDADDLRDEGDSMVDIAVLKVLR